MGAPMAQSTEHLWYLGNSSAHLITNGIHFTRPYQPGLQQQLRPEISSQLFAGVLVSNFVCASSCLVFLASHFPRFEFGFARRCACNILLTRCLALLCFCKLLHTLIIRSPAPWAPGPQGSRPHTTGHGDGPWPSEPGTMNH